MTCGPVSSYSHICLSKDPSSGLPLAPATEHKGKTADVEGTISCCRYPPTCLERHGHHKQHSIPWPMAAGHRDMSRTRHALACGLNALLGSGRETSLVLNCLFPNYKDPRRGQNGTLVSVVQIAQLLASAHRQHDLPSSQETLKNHPPQTRAGGVPAGLSHWLQAQHEEELLHGDSEHGGC